MLTLRETAEGLIEIIETRPTVLATFGERALAEDFLAWFQGRASRPAAPPEKNPRSPRPRPTRRPAPKVEGGGTGSQPSAPAPAMEPAVETPAAAPAAPAGIMTELPMVVRQPPPPATVRRPKAIPLNEREREEAIDRLTAGEGIVEVARALGLPWTQLRAVWAAHKQRLQKHMAEGGPEACSVCARPFTPSTTHPTTCARCSRD